MHPHTATCSTAPDPPPYKVGSGTATCPTAPNLASLLRWAPTLPRALRLWSLPP
jgi:hypothetical protein